MADSRPVLRNYAQQKTCPGSKFLRPHGGNLKRSNLGYFDEQEAEMSSNSAIIKEILKVFDGASPEGEQRLPDGTWLVSPAPEIAPKAWHHIMFAPPLSRSEIEDIKSSLHGRLPSGLELLYSQCNGLNLFGRMISIWGRRTAWERSIECNLSGSIPESLLIIL